MGGRRRTQAQPSLTDRQREVLALITRGFTVAEAARQLGIKPRTVRQHSDLLRHKFGVKTFRDLIRIGRELGL